MSQTLSIFQIPIYVGRLQSQEIIEKAFSKVIEKEENFATTPNWDCSVKSTLNTKHNKEHPWGVFLEEVKGYHLKEFCKTITNNSPWKNIRVNSNCWMNKYEKGDYQEVHNHTSLGIQFSCSYMFKLPTTEPLLRFRWAANDWYDSTGLSNLFQETAGPIWTSETQREGDIFIFPSFLEHLVLPNRSDEPRYTISANFYLMPDNLAQDVEKEYIPTNG